MANLARGSIQTVLGPIKPEHLGVTMCHEHLYHKSYTRTFVPHPGECCHSHLNTTSVSTETLWYTNYHPYTHEDNLDFTSANIQNSITDEMKFYKQNGGQSIVEVTTFGKNLAALATMAKKSKVNIVGNTGFYIKPAFPDSITSQFVESLYTTMKDELLNGVDGIKPGVIGEIASNWPIHQFERNVLVASAQIQSELKVPVIIHPGRHAEAPFEVMRIFAEAGGKCSKTVMSHLDRTLTTSEMLEFATTGTICELDLFGNEVSYYELSAEFDMPNDATRIAQIKALVDSGYADRITVSHDIHTKHRLMKYGGHGFSHILLNTVPKMKKRGISQRDIDQILIDNPRRWLTLCAHKMVHVLDLDNFRVNFVNLNEKGVQVWTQYEECYKCPFVKDQRNAINVSTDTTDHVFRDFPSYYTLKYQVTKLGEQLGIPVCSSSLNGQDQSVYNVTIDKTGCKSELTVEGRNNWWTLLIAIAVLLVIAAIFYVGRFFYNRRKENEGSETFKNKVSQRLNSLDAFRGLTICLMIFVNWGAGEYHDLDHAEWNGLRFADFIFPFFIFIMGTTMAISMRNLVVKKDLPLLRVYWGVVKRSIKLFLVGLVLNSRGNPDLRNVRIPGVLQRFAISYLFVAFVHIISLHINKDELYSRVSYMNDLLPFWPDWILTTIMLILHFTLTFAWKFDPDCPRGYVGPGGLSDNATYPFCVGGAANKLDKLIFTEKHLYGSFTASELYDPEVDDKKVYNLIHDPEGLLGCTMSIVLTIIGLQVGKIIVTFSSAKQRLIRWIIWSVTLGVLAAIFAGTNLIPINKNLWSFTFVCATGATAILIFTLFYLLIDHFKIWSLGHPFHYPGMNCIALYIGHDFTGAMLPFAFITSTHSHVWPLVQNFAGVTMWLLISVYMAKKNFFLTL